MLLRKYLEVEFLIDKDDFDIGFDVEICFEKIIGVLEHEGAMSVGIKFADKEGMKELGHDLEAIEHEVLEKMSVVENLEDIEAREVV